MGVKISDLGEATSASNSDLIEAEVSSKSKKITLRTAFTSGKQAASETVAGVAELATSAEVISGTDAERIVTPAGLQAKIETDEDTTDNLDTKLFSQKAIRAFVNNRIADYADIVVAELEGYLETRIPSEEVQSDLDAAMLSRAAEYSDHVVAELEAYVDSLLSKTIKTIELAVFAPTTDVAVGDGAAYFVVPDELNEYEIKKVYATVITAGTTDSTTIQIANVTQAVDVLSTNVAVETGETSSRTSAIKGTIDTENNFLTSGDVLRVDVDAASTTAPKGLIIEIECELSITALPN
ncbi:MAG TPA: hypothetical protein VJ110_01035 [Candidatus Nanoarchaeia archaeon]|nr:hypothetical protein [Candidatus Nanoarchaeia archaeon]